jgi:indole-3-glycerol phosphate synthase
MSNNNLKFFKKETWLKTLVNNSFKAIDDGYYELKKNDFNFENHANIDLKSNLMNCIHAPLITELKFASPSRGNLLDTNNINLETIVREMEKAHSCGISILTQPFLFHGSIEFILKSRKKTRLPILMKDIIVSEIQIKTAKKIGADCILLIKTIFDKNMTEGSLEKFSEYAKKIGLQVIVETHFQEEFEEILKLNKNRDLICDIIGINNRNLDTLKIDLDTTKKILSNCNKNKNLILSESGIKSKDDIMYLKDCGADAFLIGSSLMENISSLGQEIDKLYITY